MIAATVPNCRAYDPAFAYEMAVILDHGVRSMMEEGRDEFYYITAMNENYAQPSMPAGVEAGIIRGLYRLGVAAAEGTQRICPSAGLGRDPSGSGRGGADAGRRIGTSPAKSGARPASPNSPETRARRSAATGSIRSRSRLSAISALACRAPRRSSQRRTMCAPIRRLIAAYVEARFIALGTDGFGRSDTRRALRAFFEVDRYQIVIAALDALATEGPWHDKSSLTLSTAMM